jgi:hypothetical protein
MNVTLSSSRSANDEKSSVAAIRADRPAPFNDLEDQIGMARTDRSASRAMAPARAAPRIADTPETLPGATSCLEGGRYVRDEDLLEGEAGCQLRHS